MFSLIQMCYDYEDSNDFKHSPLVDWYNEYTLTKNFNDITLKEFEESKQEFIVDNTIDI